MKKLSQFLQTKIHLLTTQEGDYSRYIHFVDENAIATNKYCILIQPLSNCHNIESDVIELLNGKMITGSIAKELYKATDFEITESSVTGILKNGSRMFAELQKSNLLDTSHITGENMVRQVSEFVLDTNFLKLMTDASFSPRATFASVKIIDWKFGENSTLMKLDFISSKDTGEVGYIVSMNAFKI